jgi:NADH-quinone oxidoreductase subunit M
MAIQFLGIGILSWITFLPVVGMIIVLLIPKEARAAMKWTAVGITFLQVVLAVMIYANFNYSLGGINSQEGMQFVEKAKWIDVKGVSWFGRVLIEYFVGVDGISVPMVILTSHLSVLLQSLHRGKLTKRSKDIWSCCCSSIPE